MFSRVLRSLSRAALDLVAPRDCAGCDARLGSEDLFCATCEASIDRDVDERRIGDDTIVFAIGAYRSALARAVQRTKYERRPELAAPLGRRLATVVRAATIGPVTFVPVPLHPRKLAERGFNQSALIARAVADALGCSVQPTALRRGRDTSQQAKLGREARLDNVRGAITPYGRLDGARVVLVDDVVTTGATALACGEALRRAGATVLAVAAVARASGQKRGQEPEILASLQAVSG